LPTSRRFFLHFTHDPPTHREITPFVLLQCGDWINLKILEITPELTTLGDTLPEALELQRAHDEVLRQLKVRTATRSAPPTRPTPFDSALVNVPHIYLDLSTNIGIELKISRALVSNGSFPGCAPRRRFRSASHDRH
jgi:hypothetical protein